MNRAGFAGGNFVEVMRPHAFMQRGAAVHDMVVGWQDWDGEGRKNRWDYGLDLPGIALNAIDAVQARSENVLAKAKQPQQLPSRRQTR